MRLNPIDEFILNRDAAGGRHLCASLSRFRETLAKDTRLGADPKLTSSAIPELERRSRIPRIMTLVPTPFTHNYVRVH